ncbi:MAG: TIGR03663 family protein [Bdellovibrionaceae bacterium]|nr:TIGR03663 family protein [Pseudobdellovibrionaceae bacterium]
MLFLVLLVLCVLRFQDLALKAVHHDESINGWFVTQLWRTGWYNYDPTNYHGPLQFYLFQLGELLNGFGIETLRGVTVAFSCFWLIYLWRFWTRYQWNSKWFLFVVAISPGFLFYSRSAIHEMPFLFFLTLALGGLTEILHYQQGRGWRSLVWGLAGAILLKETWAVLALALVLSAIITGLAQKDSWLWRLLRAPKAEGRIYRLRLQATLPPDLLLHIGFSVVIIVAMYTGFGAKPSGLKDLVITYLPWFKTGVHSGGHDKPFTYWFVMLWKYEKPLLFLFLSAATSFGFFWSRLSPVARFLGLGALINVLIYSLIPYKTPWCFLAVWGPMVFAYGLIKTETRWIRFSNPFRVVFGIAALIALPYQWEETRKLNFVNPTDPDHDYVYVQTDQRLKVLVDQLTGAAEKNPALYHEKIMLAGGEPWPLAWWLGRFRTQNFTSLEKSEFGPALLIVADEKDEALARAKYPESDYEIMKFPIREGREASLYFVSRALIAGLQPPSSVPTTTTVPVQEGER